MRLITKSDNATLDELFKGAKEKEAQAITQDHLSDPADGDDAAAAPWSESKQIIRAAMEQEQHEETSSGKNKWQKLFHLITQLRQVCIHPYIIKGAAPEPYYLGEHVTAASGKFIVLDKLVERLVVQERKKVLIFAGWTSTLNLCEDLLALKGGNTGAFRYLRLDGSKGRATRNLGIR